MKWCLAAAPKCILQTVVYENLAQIWFGLMCNECVWWHAVASRMETSLTGWTAHCSPNDPCKEHDSIQAQTHRPHVLDWSGNEWPCNQQCASIA